MRIIFFGTSEFALPALQALIKNDVAPMVIVTAPDKPKGRGQSLAPQPIKKWSETAKPGLAVLQPEMIDSAFITYILNLKPDVGIVAAYGKILPKALIESFPKGVLNLHPSLLPKYRGPSPIQTTILNGDAETGVTIIQIDEKMDHGPIVAQRRLKLPIFQNNEREKTSSRKEKKERLLFFSPLLTKEGGKRAGAAFPGGGNMSISPINITYQELYDQLAKLEAQLLIEILPKWIAGKITPTPQDEIKATYTKLLKKDDGKINWSKPAEEIERMVRAYNPWPGSYTEIKNILKIKKAEILKLNQKESGFTALPGMFFKTPNGFPAVVCGKNALKLLVVQPSGKKEMPGDAYLRGHSL